MIAAAAALAALAGALTGAVWAAYPSPAPRSRPVAATVGAVIATLVFGVFLLVGAVLSLLTFSGAPETGPALLGVVIGCALFLAVTGLEALIRPRFGMPPAPPPPARRSVADLIAARPRGGPATRWLCGVALPAAPALYGLTCLVTGQGEFGTSLWRVTVTGPAAAALGVGWIGAAAFLHFHFFFGLDPGLERHSRTGKSASLVAGFGGFALAGLGAALARLS